MGDCNVIEFIKNLYDKYRIKKARLLIFSRAKIGDHSIVAATAYIKLLYGSDKKDIVIGTFFKFTGELISSHHGKIKIGNHCLVGPKCTVGAVNSVVIGNYVLISNNVVIIDNNNHPVNPFDRLFMTKAAYGHIYRSWQYAISKPIVIHDNVWIGRNVIINKGVTIGENSIIGAGSVVTKDVPSNCIAAGNPAKVVKMNIDKEPRLIPDNG